MRAAASASGAVLISVVMTLWSASALADPPPATVAVAPPATPPSTAPAASPTPQKPDPNKVDETSFNYVTGYSEGCASANLRYARQAHVKPNRDSKLYDGDRDYHEGWDHGYRKCEDHVTPGALPVMGNSSIL